MATAQTRKFNPETTTAVAAAAAKALPKVKAPAKTPTQRITEIMKRSALQNKLTTDELDVVINLANALKTFIAAK